MRYTLFAIAVFALACAPPLSLEQGGDTGQPQDASNPVDAGDGDVGELVDAGAVDTGLPEAGAPDIGSPEAGSIDTGTPEAGPIDIGRPEAGAIDIGTPEAGPVDIGTPEAGPVDIGTPEAGPPDAGPTYACDDLPAQCPDRNNWHPGLQEHHMVATDGCRFALTAPTDQEWTAGEALAARLARDMGGAVSLNTVLGDLNRTGRRSVTNQTAHRLRNHAFQGWIWNTGDNEVSYWYPQGMTGSSDAYASGLYNGRRLQLISWYHKTNDRPTKGARVSMAEITNNGVSYRHLLLVVPTLAGGQTSYKALHKSEVDTDALHAGGIVWYGNYLYVADTANGFRVFDMRKIARVSQTNDADRIGRSGGRSYAHNYRYIIPQVARYDTTEGSCDVNFSFAGLDRSSDPPTIISGEYKRDSIQGRIVSWFLDPATGRLDARQGLVFGQDAKVSAQTKMQGALTWQGNTYISSSSQWGNFGRLYRTRPGLESSISAWVYGCEDLYYERNTGIIWTAAEHPDFRDVVGIPLRVP